MINRGDLFTTGAGGTFRVLGVTATKERQVKVVHVFGIDEPTALPRQWKLTELEDGLRTGLYKKCAFRGQAVVIRASDDATGSTAKSPSEAVAERRWELISPLVGDEQIYWRQHRGKLVANRAKETGASEQTIMHCLRLYWLGGMTKDALLGGYARSGVSQNTDKNPNGATPGRKPRKDRYTKYQWSGDEEKRKVLATASKFFRKKKTNTRHYIYRRVVIAHYSFVDIDGKLRPLPLGERPTRTQVLYLLEKEQTLEKVLRRSHGDDNFENNLKPKTGSARDYANGIGQYFEIDSTIPDVWICADDDLATVIGKATLYLIVDVFSRLIVGFHLTLDAPSWSSALEAMMSLVEDKKELCARWDFEYRADDWVAHGFWPAFFRADRGPEMVSRDSDTIAKNLETGLINVPRRRAPRKGTIECTFKLIHVPIKDHVAGYTPPADIGRRQTDDHRSEASRTLKSVGQEVLAAIRLHNHKVHKGIKLPARDTYKSAQPIPTLLWQRDYEERAGMLTRYAPDYLRFKLLPQSDDFTVTPTGIFFKGLLWTPSTKAEEVKWLLPATKRFYKVAATYHRNLVDCIYVHDVKDPTKWTTMHLSGNSVQHVGKGFAEMEGLNEARLTLNELATEHNLALEIQHDQEAIERERTAQSAAQAAIRRAGGRSRTNGAVEKRDAEAKAARAKTKVLATSSVTPGQDAATPASARERAPATSNLTASTPAKTVSPIASPAATSANAALQALLNLRRKS